VTPSNVLLLALVATVTVEIAVVMAWRPVVALIAVMVATLPTALGVDARLGDVVVVALGIAIVVRLTGSNRLRVHGSLLVVAAVALLELGRGAPIFGFQQSVNESRELLYFLVTAIFFSGVETTPTLLRWFRRVWITTGGVLVISACLFWLRHGFGTYATTGERGLNGLAALLVLEATLIAIVFPWRGGVARWIPVLVGSTALLASNQRTVWLCAFVGVAVLVLTSAGARRVENARAIRVGVAVAFVGVLFFILLSPSNLSSSLDVASSSGFAGQDTLQWRVDGWSSLVDGQLDRSVVDVVLGRPFGGGFARRVMGETVPATVPPHSEYVSTLLAIGFFGLTVLVFVYARVLWRLRRAARAGRSSTSLDSLLLLVLLAVEVVYFAAYSSGLTVGTVLGLAIAVTRAPTAAEDVMTTAPGAAPPPSRSPSPRAQRDLLPIHWSGVLERRAPRNQGPA
jgi:hypothetical protein